MFMKDDNNKTGALYCSCGCEDGVLLKAEIDDWELVELSLVSDSFYTHQKNIMSFREKCKRIWNILKNEEYEYFNIIVNKKDFNEFKKFVNSIKINEDDK